MDGKTQALGLGIVLALALGLSACATKAPEPISPVRSGLACVDDSTECRSRRQIALNALLADKSNSWIQAPADASAYASGVRLFAYMKKKRELNCSELTAGLKEAKSARPTLKAATARLTTAQVARGALLGDEVSRVLKREHRRRRCKV